MRVGGTRIKWYWGRDSKPGSFTSTSGWIPGRLWGIALVGNKNFFIGVTKWRLQEIN